MVKADLRVSTPSLNTSSNNATLSTVGGVDSTRRTFLAQAAAAAAGGAAIGAALPLPGSAAAAGLIPNPILDAIPGAPSQLALTLDASLASDELRSAFGKAHDAYEALKSAWAEYQRVNELMDQWHKRNPEPVVRRAIGKYERRWRKYHEAVNYYGLWGAYQDAREDFETAKMVVAGVKPRDLNELVFKATAVWIFEDMREEHLRAMNLSIALSVAVDLTVMAASQTKGAAA
jgi:hypothetical protein